MVINHNHFKFMPRMQNIAQKQVRIFVNYDKL